MSSSSMPQGSQGQQPKVPKSVFITGANGFIGRALYKRYSDLGCRVSGMDLFSDETRNVVQGDLKKPEQWRDAASNCELFINTAAIVSLAAEWHEYREGSMQGVRNALDVAIAGGAKRFVHFSSIAAMGYDYPEGADEKTPVVIGSEYRYGVAKGGSEHVVLAAHASGEMECTIIRPGDVYGPGSRAWLIEPLKMARSGQLFLPNGGQGVFTPAYIEDLLDGAMLAAGLDEGIGQIFILWNEETVTCQEFFSNHWRWAGKKGYPPTLPLRIAEILMASIRKVNKSLGRPNEASPDVMRMFARKHGYSTNKARTLLGYEPKVKLLEGMMKSEAWLKEIGELY